jgi:hypothetical protein
MASINNKISSNLTFNTLNNLDGNTQGERKQPTLAKDLPKIRNTPVIKGRPDGMTDADIDKMIEDGKTEKFLKGQGSSYRVHGNEVPDSHSIQRIANKHKISIEIMASSQNEDQAEVTVRGYKGEQFCDAVVVINFKDELYAKMLEVAEKNPSQVVEWAQGYLTVLPKFAKDATDTSGKNIQVMLSKHMLNTRQFAIRSARTKAARIVESILLNSEWQEKEEIDSEQDERNRVSNK